jgi:arylsulfatase
MAVLVWRAALAADSAPPPVVVVFAFDGLRASHLGCYGARVHTSPAIDALCAAGVAFDRAYAQSASAAASVASLLTSRLPSEHGVVADADVLPAQVPTLPSALASAGWVTAGFTADPGDAPRGLSRGFRDFVTVPTPSDDVAAAPSAAERLAFPAVAWVHAHHRELLSQGVLLYVRQDVARLGRVPPLEFVRRFFPAPFDPVALAPLERRAADVPDGFTPDDVHTLAVAHDAGVALADDVVARVLGELRQPEVAQRLWAFVLAPYGEALGEHGLVGHGTSLYDEALRVPLVVLPPLGRRGGLRRSEPVALLDVAPTVLALAGVAPEPGFRGRDLRAAFDDGPLPSADVVAELPGPEAHRLHTRATIGPDLRKRLERVDGRTEVYDLRTDPGEGHDLAR